MGVLQGRKRMWGMNERLHKEIMIESLLYFKRNTDLLVHEAQSVSHKRASPRPTAIVKPKVKNNKYSENS